MVEKLLSAFIIRLCYTTFHFIPTFLTMSVTLTVTSSGWHSRLKLARLLLRSYEPRFR